MVAPQPQGQANTTVVAAGTSVTLTTPTNLAVGDYLLVGLRGQSSNTTAVVLPTGFSRLGPAFMASNASYRVNGIYGYRVTNVANTPASFTFTLTGSSTSRIVAHILNVRYVHNDVLDSFYDSYWGTLQSTGVKIPSYTTKNPECMTFVIAASEFAANNNENPTVADNDYGTYAYAVSSTNQATGRTAMGIYARIENTATSTNEFITQWGSPSGQAAESVTLRGGTYVPPTQPVTHLAGKIYDGTSIVDGYYQLYDGTTVQELSNVTTVWSGLKVNEFHQKVLTAQASVNASRAAGTTPNAVPPTVAHRLGSVDYAEHSMRGATECAINHVDAMEFSVARTSDGVWFGLHDATLDRTTPSVTNYNPSEHTWAEISQLQCSVGNAAGFGPQPYLKLSDFADIYAKSHTIFIDPKVIGSANIPSLITYLQTIPNYQNTFVGKYYHTGTNVATLFRAAGLRSWGYAYTADTTNAGNQNISATYTNWDYLGLEYNATQATWDTMLSYGKPVFAHITPDLASARTGISRGASGLMISGVRSVMGAGGL